MVSEAISESGLNRDGVTVQAFISGALDVQPIPSTNMIKVNVTSRDPAKARLAATLLAKKVVVKSHGIDQAGETTARDDLEKQIAEAKTNLNKAEQRLLDLQVSYEVELLEAEVRSKVARRVDVDAVDTELEAERARLLTLQQELERQPARLGVPQVRDDPETDRFANPVYTMLQYDIAQSKAKIASLERKRGQTVGATAGKAVTNQRGELYRRRLDLARLQAVYDANNRIYADLVARYEQVRARTAGSAPQLKMLDDAALPDQPIPRRRAQWGLFGGLIGLLVGIVAALLINSRRVLQLATP
jgi:tyrosine-protein kinase Etk/Wzc